MKPLQKLEQNHKNQGIFSPVIISGVIFNFLLHLKKYEWKSYIRDYAQFM